MTRPRLLLGLLVAAFVLLPTVAQGAESDAVPRVQGILSSLHASPPAEVPEAARRLGRLGPDALPALLQAWWNDPTRAPASRGARHRPSPTCDALGRAIAGHPHDELLRNLEAHGEAHPGDETRLLLLETVAAFGKEAALPFSLNLVCGLDASWQQTSSLIATWRAVLERLLSETRRPVALRTEWERVPVRLRAPSCRVLVERGRRADLSLVLDLAAEETEVAPALYWELAHASPVVLSRLDALPRLRRQLGREDPVVRAAVATFLGRLGQPAAFADLRELLDDENADVRQATEAALRALSGVSFGAQHGAWNAWYAAERAWLDSAGIAERLRAEDPVAISRALRELCGHPMVAATLVENVAELIRHGNRGIQLLACAALHSLGRPEAAPLLVDGLRDEDPRVRQAVWQALKRLSGESLPLDTRAWSQARRRWDA